MSKMRTHNLPFRCGPTLGFAKSVSGGAPVPNRIKLEPTGGSFVPFGRCYAHTRAGGPARAGEAAGAAGIRDQVSIFSTIRCGWPSDVLRGLRPVMSSVPRIRRRQLEKLANVTVSTG